MHAVVRSGTEFGLLYALNKFLSKISLINKKVLVTGADGFIGSHLVEALLDEGCDVKAFVFYNSFNSKR